MVVLVVVGLRDLIFTIFLVALVIYLLILVLEALEVLEDSIQVLLIEKLIGGQIYE